MTEKEVEAQAKETVKRWKLKEVFQRFKKQTKVDKSNLEDKVLMSSKPDAKNPSDDSVFVVHTAKPADNSKN